MISVEEGDTIKQEEEENHGGQPTEGTFLLAVSGLSSRPVSPLVSPQLSPLFGGTIAKKKKRRYFLLSRGTRRQLRRKIRRWKRFCLEYSLLEHAMFFLGTLCAVLAAVMDVQEAIAYSDDDDDDDSDDRSNGGSNPLLVWNITKFLWVASTLFYLLDTVLEYDFNFFSRWQQQQQPRNDVDSNEHKQEEQERQHRFNVPALFGLGALFDLFSSLFEDESSPWLGFCSEVLCVHFFLFCAIFTMNRHFIPADERTSQQTTTRYMKLMMLGDSLFLLGALLDTAASYGDHPTVSDEEGRTQWIFNASLSLASSLTWMVDSILYLLADFLEDDDDDDDEDEKYADENSRLLQSGLYPMDYTGSSFKESDEEHHDGDTEACSLDNTTEDGGRIIRICESEDNSQV